MSSPPSNRSPWSWVPTLYFAEGIPYVVVMTVSVIMYKRLGISNTEIALYTSWLYLPWIIKPLWSPLVDLFKTKRHWVVVMQLLIGAALAGVALTIPASNFFKLSLALLWLLAFSSATHDIAADGFYMLGLSKHDQTWFVGVRSTFYRIAAITGQGLLIILAGTLETKTGLPALTIEARAQPGGALAAPPDPASVQPASQSGDLQLLTSEAQPTIPAVPRTRQEVDAITARAREWNRANGFVASDSPGAQTGTAAKQPSLWNRTVSKPLEELLRKWFPPREKSGTTGQQGNVGVIFLSLSKEIPAGNSMVVNLTREAGDKSFRVIEGERAAFSGANWNKPMMVVFQLDPKVNHETTATFVARSGNIPLAWSLTFYFLAAMFIGLAVYHRFMLPVPATDKPTGSGSGSRILAEFVETLASFFKKPAILSTLAFLLLYRFAEAQLGKMAAPFLLDSRELGGLGLSTGAVGFVYGTVGIISLTLGGLSGGFVAARNGLKFWLIPMVLAINLPNCVYIYLAYVQPANWFAINSCVAIEQFGYGFGFTAYMLYMIYAVEGEHKTAHYAICTGFMALGMMIPGMFSGWLQDIIGYQRFFVWVMIATIPGFIVTFLIKVDPQFGKKAPATA